MLILGVGSGTKALSTFLNCWKTYETVVVFGAATDTYDRLGKVVARDETGFQEQQEQVEIEDEEEEERNRRRNPFEHVTREKVLDALDRFKGKFWQIPPIYSAKWMNGKRLYEYARQGLPLPEEIKGKEVEVGKMEMLEWLEPGTHGYSIPDNVVDQAVDDADGDGNSGNKKKKDEKDDGVAVSAGTEQMARSVKRARGDDDGKDGGVLTSDAASTAKSPLQTTLHSPKRVKLDTQVNEPVVKSHDMDVRTDTLNTEQIETLFPNTSTTATTATTTTATNDEDIISTSAHKTTISNTNIPINAASSSSSSYETSTIPSESQSRSQQPPLEQQSHHNHQDPSSPSPPAVKLRMTVSSGFYVRSLCHDLGIAIGSFGFMADLVRTRQADFELGLENQGSKKSEDTDHNDGKDKDMTKDKDDGKEKKQKQKKGNVLEYADLQKGEEVWGPRVKDLIRDDWGQSGKQISRGRGRNGNGNWNWRGTDRARKNTSSPE